MRINKFPVLCAAIIAHCVLSSWNCQLLAQSDKATYPLMAPVGQYLMADEAAEIAMARSAAPASISGNADVMVLDKDGYKTAAKGSNGFLCIVERSWAKPTDDPEFWNPKVRAPNCFNKEATQTFVPIYLMKTRLAMAGKPKAEIAAATTAAFEKKEIRTLAPAAMCYMMSKQQYLSDRDVHWHPHVMFFAPGNAVKSSGADQDGSPIIAVEDPEEQVTIFMFLADSWSDGSPSRHAM